MSESATDSQNLSQRDDLVTDSEPSVSGANSVSSNVFGSEVSSRNIGVVNVDDEINSSEHVSAEKACVAFQSIRDLYIINIAGLEMYRVEDRFYDLGGDVMACYRCVGDEVGIM
ncbi:hypothetical protein FRX31_018836 [Thalictrum thalictroides]|uniref:Uncharacterized protein n=1 Tax=Thalictrum thalictroides TaxID=46969 RepID=A0A7J6W2H9_THATH|nr:hypothetical protein FRX31_018836 [Thalictrum thalictroides]